MSFISPDAVILLKYNRLRQTEHFKQLLILNSAVYPVQTEYTLITHQV